ncbi:MULTISPECIES: hypothetical protein [unclassified Roseofilum]|uniref:hypothetical protein n=1 Tax=unclassified Roseofilum TaxID=2620099 RepID=UPI001B07E5DA|nr:MULTISPECIES: hypothetical protein [unclassified Roseofilum]MBP0007149.1 hypothetical protein [Roseofilum sp. Belize Diploria]MBP0032089.1 hypothetical protein [Roseofilum sp. Belize BBD 4]
MSQKIKLKPILGELESYISGSAKTIDFSKNDQTLVLGNNNHIEFYNLEGDLLKAISVTQHKRLCFIGNHIKNNMAFSERDQDLCEIESSNNE